jgi:hypothetical protein
MNTILFLTFAIAARTILTATAQPISIPIQPSLPSFTYNEDVDEWIHPVYPSDELREAVLKWCAMYSPSSKREACHQIVASKAAVALREARRQEGALLAAFKRVPMTGRHGITSRFLDIVSPIYNAEYGTEQMAPLLHSLVRFHRPQTIVELGYGYTTPFLAQGLADNAINSAMESHHGSPASIADVLHKPWYESNNIDVGTNVSTTKARLITIDDHSQRGADSDAASYLDTVKSVLKRLKLDHLVTLKSKVSLTKAHQYFMNDSIDMLWNDATWDPEFMKKWWPKLKNDGGLMLLHNPIGNADDGERWCVASPTRTLKLAVCDDVRSLSLSLSLLTHTHTHTHTT